MGKNKGLLIVLGILVIIFFWGCNVYNGLIGVDQDVKNKWGNVETNYQRRMDLYNSVIKVVEGSANFEKSTLVQVIQARAAATSVQVNLNDSASLARYQQAQAGMQSAFARLMAVAEQYPDLKSTKAFSDFQTQIEGTENRINVARQDYNTAVNGYNLRVKRFPGNLFAGMFGYHEKAYYKSDEGSQKAPDIKFDIK